MADTIPANTSTTASIGVGGTVSGTLETVNDHDWYKVTLTAGQSVTITIDGISLIDSYLRVWDSTGTTQLFYNDDIIDGTNRDSQVSFSAPTTGTYYIDVGSYNEQYAGTYTVSVQPYTPPPVATNDQIANQLGYGFWGGTSQHFNVHQGGTITVNIASLTPAEQTLARSALAEWSDLIGVNFQEVTFGAQIDFDNSEGKNGAIAATDSDTSGGFITHSHVHVSSSWVNNYGTSLYSYSFQTYVHEIGHALGLGHAGNYNNTATYPYDALFQNDSWATSVMSYFDQSENTYFAGQGFTVDYAVTPMVADILAMQTLYGLSTATRTGDTIYGYNTNAGGVYDASLYPRAAYTIFDSGGNDTLDFSGSAANQLLNLNPETFSNVNGKVGNLSIARGVVIENATGGSGSDTIIGNSSVNVIKGGAGSDTLTGGGGNDIYLDTIAGHSGDRITDFNVGDKLIFSNAVLGNFTFNLSGGTLSYSGGSMTLSSLSGGTLVASAASSGGVQLVLANSNTSPSTALNDYNGDGRSDILLVDNNGTVIDWLGNPDGGFFSNHAATTLSLPGGWHVAQTGDFNGDSRADVLLRSDNGSLTEWLGQANGSFAWNSSATYSLDNSWQIKGVGDFNADGQTDLLVVNSNGSLTDWLGQSNGTFFSNHAAATYTLTAGWVVAGTGDFNGDGHDDVLLRNSSGMINEWLGQDNGGFAWNSKATYGLATSWHVAGTGDFDGDGRDDVLLRNDNGLITEWQGQGDGTFVWKSAVTYNLDNSWHIQQIGDFNGDHRDDLLLRNDSGSITEWLGAAGGTFAWNSNASYSLSTVWHVQPAHDLV